MRTATSAFGGTKKIYFAHPVAFWLGTVAVSVGVLLHVPMFTGASGDGYKLVGMQISGLMLLGMALILAGFVLTYIGLAPRITHRASESHLKVQAFDDAKLRPAHYRLIAVLLVAIAVDTLKPFTFAFIIPGVTLEYGLRSATHPAPGALPVALWPFVAITGTAIGSFLWGYLADRIGRRATVLMGAIIFIGTAICSFMPTFGLNILMCFIMGLGVGGLLPIAYSLLTETIPARNRGMIVVLVAGVGTALGFLLASGAAGWLIPHYSWRIMWFLGLPTGLILILLNRWIPESPRYLLANGRDAEAQEVMAEFGVTTVEVVDRSAEDVIQSELHGQGFGRVFRAPFSGLTIALVIYGLAWGLVNFGFIVWLPAKLGAEGLTATHVT
ncbi:MAG: MFS transporter, partial [Actinomycetota bacterium]|nr:MFS transporter [Actinomycetota bacterium]